MILITNVNVITESENITTTNGLRHDSGNVHN